MVPLRAAAAVSAILLPFEGENFLVRPQSDACYMTDQQIRIRGARQNNLQNLDLDLPLNELIVVTGVSGSGKSSLAFDTVYSEGQRRYVETFSPYARQFLDRMDKPQVDRIEGIPPAIAIDQTNPVRTSRSTVGTMTEINDHVKLLFARAAVLYCRNCGREVRRDDAESIHRELAQEPRVGGAAARVLVTFGVTVPENFSRDEVQTFLARQGYTRIRARSETAIEVIQDRVAFDADNRSRLIEALETALKFGNGRLTVRLAESEDVAFKFSAHRHCAPCDLSYGDPVPNSFSFNSPIGACENCRGFGRTIGIDYRLVIPDEEKTLAGGAIKPWQTKSNKECQDDLLRFARERRIPVDVPWSALTPEQRGLGDRRRRLLAPAQMVRSQTVFRVARRQELQDARPRAAVEVSFLRRLPGVRRRALEERVALVAARHACRRK